MFSANSLQELCKNLAEILQNPYKKLTQNLHDFVYFREKTMTSVSG